MSQPTKRNSASYTRIKDFESCPYRFELKYIQKLQETASVEADRGISLHKQIEDYLEGKTDDYPNTFFQEDMYNWRLRQPVVEEQWGHTFAWAPCNWFDAGIRVVPDFYWYNDPTATLFIHDLKTGKKNPIIHASQGQLYACAGFNRFPNLEVIHIQFWYIDTGEALKFSIKRPTWPKLQDQWSERITRLAEAKKFPANPTKNNCKYCGVKSHCWYEYDS
jgi:CRISPR/Cas system-associated exonuclease Cas4 (RecB family)